MLVLGFLRREARSIRGGFLLGQGIVLGVLFCLDIRTGQDGLSSKLLLHCLRIFFLERILRGRARLLLLSLRFLKLRMQSYRAREGSCNCFRGNRNERLGILGFVDNI